MDPIASHAELYGVAGTVVAILLVSLFKAARDFASDTLRSAWTGLLNRLANRDPHPGPGQTMSTSRLVHEAVTRLQAQMGASRAYIYEFHNGMYFSSDNPVWKISETYEVCANGIQHQASCMSGTLVTLLLDVIEPMFETADVEYPGTTLLSSELCARHKLPNDAIPACHNDRTMVFFNIEALAHSNAKQTYIIQGQKSMLWCSIRDTRGNMIGILGVDFFDPEMSAIRMGPLMHHMCETSDQVAGLLTRRYGRRK